MIRCVNRWYKHNILNDEVWGLTYASHKTTDNNENKRRTDVQGKRKYQRVAQYIMGSICGPDVYHC